MKTSPPFICSVLRIVGALLVALSALLVLLPTRGEPAGLFDAIAVGSRLFVAVGLIAMAHVCGCAARAVVALERLTAVADVLLHERLNQTKPAPDALARW